MNTRRALPVLVILLLAFSHGGRASEPDFKSPLSGLELQDGVSIVFLGDSITHQCLYTQYVEDFFYTRYPHMRLKLHNAGVGGAKAWDALQRFDRDVAAYKPKYVTVLLGMNDGRYQPYDEETFQTYRRDMTELIARIRKTGATPVLMTPTMFDSRAARMRSRRRNRETLELYNSVLSFYGTWLREVATENGYGFVDMFSPLNNLTLGERKSRPTFTMIPDAVHPGPAGQLVMAYAMIEQLGLRGPVSNIRIATGPRRDATARAQGGDVSDLKRTDDGLEFAFTAECLPLVVPEEAQPGARLLRLGHRASREAIEVHGLPAGRYELSIDGVAVGIYTSLQLERHVELQGNSKTPQYRQAAEVAELNKQRNGGPVRALRNEWRTFQQYARLKQQLENSPDDQKLARQVEQLGDKLEGLEERIRQHEQRARQIEDRIFAVNRPRPRKYTLTRTAPEAARGAQVSGTVTLDGLPLDGATITFHPARGKPVAATTDEAGNYLLRRREGLPPGEYRVSISRKTNGKQLVPERYSDDQKSALKVRVKSGRNVFDFELATSN